MARPKKQQTEVSVEGLGTGEQQKETEICRTPSDLQIIPSVRVSGEKHILEEILEETPDEMPEMKAVGYIKVGDARSSWISYTVKFKGTKVLSMEVDEPNIRAVAEESAKIAFVQAFIDQEF